MENEQPTATARLSLPTLEYRGNTYVVPEGGMFHYFPIKIEDGPETSGVLRFEKAPPILVDGLVMYKRKIYEVSERDILRLVVLKSKQLVTEGSRDGSAEDQRYPEQAAYAEAGNAAVQHSGESGALRVSGVEVDKAADAAWAEQIDALLDSLSQEEGGEWEVAGSAQS